MNIITRYFQIISCFLIYYPIFKLFLKFEVKGRKNLKGFDSPVIFTANHGCYLDGPISALSTPIRFFPIRFSAREKHFCFLNNEFSFPQSVMTAIFLRANGCIPTPNKNLHKFLSSVVHVLKRNGNVFIYPEGGFSKDGNLQKGKKGVVLLYKKTKVPLVPIRIIGNFKISFRDFILCRRKVKVKIGKPYYLPEDISSRNGVKIVMQKIRELNTYD